MDKSIELFSKILDESPGFLPALDKLGRALIIWGHQVGATGWFSIYEAAYLYRLVRELENPAPVIIELGSCFGLSSMIIAKALSNKPDALIYCIDAWEEDGSSVSQDTREFVQDKAKSNISFFEIFQNNMKEFNVDHQLIPIKAYTSDVAKIWTQEADLIFVDADHSYEGVCNDVSDWKDCVKVGGQILLHDLKLEFAGSDEYSAPGRVVNELLGENSNFSSGTLVDSLYLAERLR